MKKHSALEESHAQVLIYILSSELSKLLVIRLFYEDFSVSGKVTESSAYLSGPYAKYNDPVILRILLGFKDRVLI